ncbi:MAG: hypothetical protein A2754_02935 [Candidatus Magasanikbacteria bacterium RIFCSPHIGHO2_01_FULL_47_8]|uniref:Fatty acid desaturase domain-containing protein n=1 Tax=Candidatus Magasanikbacteria bacterium RIFCSPHIGHO2_01_FULL_47_8 TaxID=1798673 RepID=A0A1F6MDE7_9BACT|nr:MAG: hypothetical protein A2754_02935 [Candidatus Magasanikbacteria bacterium RIFCSPHIGHO2_01_FULL_47_8]
MATEHAELRALVKIAGLFDKRPRYYAYKMLLNAGLLILGIAVLFVWDALWIRLLDAVFLAFVFGQAAYVGHDAGHRQITNSDLGNEFIRVFSSFFIAISRTWWISAHDEHHKNPNNLGKDPHTRIPLMAFSRDQAQGMGRVARFFIRFQAYHFIFLMMAEGVGMRTTSVGFLLRSGLGNLKKAEELIIIALHFGLYFGLIFSVMSVGQAILFIIVHQVFFGLYMALVFAPNHKGMLIVDDETKLDSLRLQVLTTRNVKPGFFNDLWYGGLNYQIEHHLFPWMPRCNLGKARLIVKKYCEDHEIPYCETSSVESWRQILRSLRGVSASV